jgi:hypothetical protein
MIEIAEERVVRWVHQDRKFEMRISDDNVEMISDDGQVFKAQLEIWNTISSVLAARTMGVPTPKREGSTRAHQGEPWSAELDHELRQLWMAGETVANLSAHFGRTTGGIASRLTRLEIVASRKEAKSRKTRQ